MCVICVQYRFPYRNAHPTLALIQLCHFSVCYFSICAFLVYATFRCAFMVEHHKMCTLHVLFSSFPCPCLSGVRRNCVFFSEFLLIESETAVLKDSVWSAKSAVATVYLELVLNQQTPYVCCDCPPGTSTQSTDNLCLLQQYLHCTDMSVKHPPSRQLIKTVNDIWWDQSIYPDNICELHKWTSLKQ